MTAFVRMNQRAFNRGVDEVLLLKPLRRVAAQLISQQPTKPLKNKPTGKTPSDKRHNTPTKKAG